MLRNRRLLMLAALAILAVCSFAPGFYFVRRFAWSGLEKLCGSIALSLILLWLAAITCLALVLLQIAEWIIDFRAPCNRIAIDPTCDHELLVGERGRSFAA